MEIQKLCHGFKESGLEGTFVIIEFIKPSPCNVFQRVTFLSLHKKVKLVSNPELALISAHPAAKKLRNVNDF